MDLHIPVEVFDDVEGDGSVLVASRALGAPALSINGVSMHVTALRVRTDNGVQVSDYLPDHFPAMHEAMGGDGPFQTATMNGDEYVIVLEPFCG